DYFDGFNTSGWSYKYTTDMWGTPFWWSKMMTDPAFLNKLYCRWHEFRQGVLSDESILARIDSAVAVIGDAADRNFNQWPIHGQYVWPTYFVGNTYEQDINYMKTWITDRTWWMDSHIPGSSCLSPVSDLDATYTFLLRAYPNPAIEEVNIEVQNERSLNLSLEIFNYTGQLVFSKQLAGGPLIIEKVRLRPGAYLVKVSGKENSKIQKIRVQ
ncbi:MAG TPA: CotH kinase family protein, partial [Bacteroidales bacterium]|nr:CotH kinase family protein [Bacteroidales bacterium]